MSGGDLNYDELVLAARNVGVDLGCGRCACVFYTGSAYPGPPPHDPGCATAAREAVDRERRGRRMWVFEQTALHTAELRTMLGRLDSILSGDDEVIPALHARYVEAVQAYQAARVALLESP